MKSAHINNNHWNTLVNIRHHMYEYLLVFSCDQVTEALLHNVKRYFEENYGCKYAANLTPNLTLLKCTIHESKADRIIQGLSKVSKHMSPLQIGLTRFDKYEHGTFYVDVDSDSSENVLNLVRKVRNEVGAHVKQWAPAEYHFCDDPHFTIARNMTASQTERANMDWLYREFTASFQASEMRLMRRSLIHGAKYETVARFSLLGMPEGQYMQASLF